MNYEKLIIFDLDGVLIDSRELHYKALNEALHQIDEKYVISREEHLARYDGLPTKKKLQMLTQEKGLPVEQYNAIYHKKQAATLYYLAKDTQPVEKHKDIMFYLHSKGYKIAVASNSIRKTVQVALHCLGLTPMVDYTISNEDVLKSKPFPEMYWKCMQMLHAIPSTTIIVEDSHIGRQGAIDSGATLLPVEDQDDLTFEKVKNMVEKKESGRATVPWRSKELNVLIPMAGAGSRFAAAGYTFPKPLIEVNGKPMIQVVVENLNIEANYIFICQREHYEKYNLKYMLNLIAPGCKIVLTEGMTEGAACTTLLAKEYINNDAPLVIANSDQYVEWNSNEAMYAFSADQIDGGLLTFKATHPKWSYVKLDDHGFVTEVAEKRVISDVATVGVYYWKKGSDYVKYAEQMIEKNIRTNNEFYVCPVFNEAIADGKLIRPKQIERMWGIGTPEDLNEFLRHHG
jgi:HAD superfamily hydrolase (TIGR01509 family)